MRMSGRGTITSLHIMVNFMEKSPQEAKSHPDKKDSYWAVVQAMQQHEQFLEGMLLRNIEAHSPFPYIHYIVFDTTHQDFLVGSKLSRVVHESFTHSHLKNLGGYEEVFTFTEPSLAKLPKRPSNANAAYIVSAFKAVDDNAEALMDSWSIWSGADFIVANVPPHLKLQRVTLHRAVSNATFSFILMCELGEALSDLNRTRDFIERIRSRECGYTSVFTIDHFF